MIELPKFCYWLCKTSPAVPDERNKLFRSSNLVTEDWDKLSTLFQNLQSVKHRIASLSREEKLKEAEIAVKAFWRAVDGDEEEISDGTLLIQLRHFFPFFTHTEYHLCPIYMFADDDNSKNVDQN